MKPNRYQWRLRQIASLSPRIPAADPQVTARLLARQRTVTQGTNRK